MFEATDSVALEEAEITLLRVPIDNLMTVANVPNTGDAPLLPTPLGGWPRRELASIAAKSLMEPLKI